MKKESRAPTTNPTSVRLHKLGLASWTGQALLSYCCTPPQAWPFLCLHHPSKNYHHATMRCSSRKTTGSTVSTATSHPWSPSKERRESILVLTSSLKSVVTATSDRSASSSLARRRFGGEVAAFSDSSADAQGWLYQSGQECTRGKQKCMFTDEVG